MFSIEQFVSLRVRYFLTTLAFNSRIKILEHYLLCKLNSNADNGLQYYIEKLYN